MKLMLKLLLSVELSLVVSWNRSLLVMSSHDCMKAKRPKLVSKENLSPKKTYNPRSISAVTSDPSLSVENSVVGF